MATQKVTGTGQTLDSGANTKMNYTESTGAGVNSYMIQDDATTAKLLLRGTGDTVMIEGLSGEYTVKASGKTVTLQSDSQKITLVLNDVGGAAAVTTKLVFLDGQLDLTAAAKSKSIKLGDQSLEKKAADITATVTASDAAANAFDQNGGTTTNSGSGQTFTLTAGVDVGSAFVAGAGNDTFNANVAVNPATGIAEIETLTALDEIDGGAGTDTLNYITVGATALPAATIKNVEVISVTSDGAATADVSVSSITGVTTLNAKATGAAVDLDTKSNVTSISVTGTATTVDIDDAGTAATTADKLATVSVTGATGNITIDSDVFTTLNLTNTTDGDATITAAAGTRALTVNLNNVTGPGGNVVITDDEATSLTVKTTGGVASSGIDLEADKATAVTIDADEKLTIALVDLSAAKTIDIKGDSLVTFTTNVAADLAALETVSSASSTGGVTLTTALATGVVFTGGAGADTLTVGATTKAITTGGGDDKVTVAGVSALGTGGSIDAGAGTADTLAFSTFANGVTASATATFEGTVSNFERVELSGANGTDGATINLANLDDINYVVYSATNTKDSVLSNLASGGTVVVKADQTATEGLVVQVKDAATGTADVLNIGLSKDTALANVEITAADVETVNITSTETATTLLGTVTHAATLSATAAKSLVITGNAGVTLGTLTGATALTSIDASGVSTGLVSLTTAALTSAATIKGGAGANTIVASNATKAVTYIGQDKVDQITINNALDNSVTTAAGNDVIVTGSGADTITAGAGDDNITSGTGLDIIYGGAGNDTFTLVASANGNIYATIKDLAAGDILNFADKGTETFASTKLSLGGTAVFQDYLNLAAAGDGSTHGALSWFQFGGDTYVVEDKSAGATFVNGTDIIVKVSGLVDLSTATVGDHILTIA